MGVIPGVKTLQRAMSGARQERILSQHRRILFLGYSSANSAVGVGSLVNIPPRGAFIDACARGSALHRQILRLGFPPLPCCLLVGGMI